MILRLLQTKPYILLRLGHVLQARAHRHLEALQVLHDARELVVLVEVEQLLGGRERRGPVRGVAFAAEGEVGEVEACGGVVGCSEVSWRVGGVKCRSGSTGLIRLIGRSLRVESCKSDGSGTRYCDIACEREKDRARMRENQSATSDDGMDA